MLDYMCDWRYGAANIVMVDFVKFCQVQVVKGEEEYWHWRFSNLNKIALFSRTNKEFSRFVELVNINKPCWIVIELVNVNILHFTGFASTIKRGIEIYFWMHFLAESSCW